MSRLDAVSFISHGVGKGGATAEAATPKGADDEESAKADKTKSESALKQLTVNLNEKAENGKVDPLIGRGPEVERTNQNLDRKSDGKGKRVSVRVALGGRRNRKKKNKNDKERK